MFLAFGSLSVSGLADPTPATPSDSQPEPAFPVTKQIGPLENSAGSQSATVEVGGEWQGGMPFEIASATYTDDEIATVRAVGPKEIIIEGKKVGQTQIALWLKYRPQIPYIIKVTVKEVVPQIPASLLKPSGKLFPVKQEEHLPVATGPVTNLRVPSGGFHEVRHNSGIIEATYSNGAVLEIVANSRFNLVVIGKGVGQGELAVRVRRTPTDTVGEVKRYAISILKPFPIASSSRIPLVESLEAEIKKRDERIKELERRLAEKTG